MDDGFLQGQSFLSLRTKKRFTPTWEAEILVFFLSENFLLHFRKKPKTSERIQGGWAPGFP